MEANLPTAFKDENMIPMDAEDISPFHLVAQTFAKIGLLTFDQFLQAPADINDCGGSYHYCDRTPTPPPALGDKVDSNVTGLAVADDNKVACITRLHQACQRAFGRTDVLKYEFIEVHGPNSKSISSSPHCHKLTTYTAKQCILTITRPGPSTSSSTNTRSYTTPTTYHRKSEAKAHTSALAISLGALEFISTGFTKADSASSQPGLVLEPLKAHDDAPPDGVERKDGEDNGKVDEGVRRIENCWAEWRGGLKSKPGWVEYDGKPHDSGCTFRSTSPIYSSHHSASDSTMFWFVQTEWHSALNSLPIPSACTQQTRSMPLATKQRARAQHKLSSKVSWNLSSSGMVKHTLLLVFHRLPPALPTQTPAPIPSRLRLLSKITTNLFPDPSRRIFLQLLRQQI